MRLLAAFFTFLARIVVGAASLVLRGIDLVIEGLVSVFTGIDTLHRRASASRPIRGLLLALTLLFGTGSLFDGWPLIAHGFPVWKLTTSEKPAAGDVAQMQFDFSINGVSVAIDCDAAGGEKLVRRHIGPFADGEPMLLMPPQKFMDAVHAMVDTLKKPSHSLVGAVLIGAADERPLKGKALSLYHTNQNLAKLRASNVQSEMKKYMGARAPKTMVAVLREAEIEGSGHTSQELEPDRVVEVCAVWGS